MSRHDREFLLWGVLCLTMTCLARADTPPEASQVSRLEVRVRFTSDVSPMPLDGRVLVIFSKDPAEEPRLQINDSPKTQQIFGIDVEGSKPGEDAVVDAEALGLSAGEPGATCRPARTACRRCCTATRRSAAPTATRSKLPMDRGEGQQWNRAPGNLYSHAARGHDRPGAGRSRSRSRSTR